MIIFLHGLGSEQRESQPFHWSVYRVTTHSSRVVLLQEEKPPGYACLHEQVRSLGSSRNLPLPKQTLIREEDVERLAGQEVSNFVYLLAKACYFYTSMYHRMGLM